MPSQRRKVTFTNAQGQQLAGLLELPARQPIGYALFAHCFTCGKDIGAASRIARGLAAQGIATLRFDFTGLGGSDGDFANSNFSSNVQDLRSAADMLRRDYAAPAILVGHSLGGAAVLAAAESVPEARAVVTIAAPASPDHVVHNFAAHLDQIEADGVAEVSLAGRPFSIQKQFLDDLREQSLAAKIRHLRKALLVFHSPVDDTVGIAEAGKIYEAALHPKSFVSLHDADHLLQRREDAEYVADTLSAWVKRYLCAADKETTERPTVSGGHVLVTEQNQRFTRGVFSDEHHWLADEPKSVGGDNFGPDPYEHLLAALGACTSMTMRMYANRKQWPLEDVDVSLQHGREHAADCERCAEHGGKLDVLSRSIRIEGDQLSDQQRQQLMAIADRCPVHKTLSNEIDIRTEAAD